MIIAHLADLHIGFQRFQRHTTTGINQREADVANAFRECVDRLIAIRPDVILFAGDIFHSVRPSNPAILFAFSQFSRLTQSLPHALVVMVAGNHDTPRTAGTGSILPLFRTLGIHVVEREPQLLRFESRDLSICAVPETGGHQPLQFVPNVTTNILLLHGEVAGVVPYSAPGAWTLEQIKPPLWTYVALGHYHARTEVAPNAFYSGAIEYTSSDPWHEPREKGFLTFDTETKRSTFHTVKVREHCDLDPIDAAGLAAADIDELLRLRVATAPVNFNGAVARQVVTNLPTTVRKDLDYKAIRNYKARALHYQLDAATPPDRVRTSVDGIGEERPRRPSLDEMLRAKLAENRSADDAAELDALGAGYLKEAEDASMIGEP
jgi:DNA repair protein SbcD/Mre11